MAVFCLWRFGIFHQKIHVNLYDLSFQSFESERKHLEEELESTKSKVLRLQEAIVSPSGDVKSSAINRLIFEHPPPINLTILNESPPQKPSTSSSSSSRQRKKSMSDFFDISDDDNDGPMFQSQPTKKSKLSATSSTTVAVPCKDVSNK